MELARPYLSVYSATKGGLEVFSRTLAVELRPERIRVSCPGRTGRVRCRPSGRCRKKPSGGGRLGGPRWYPSRAAVVTRERGRRCRLHRHRPPRGPVPAHSPRTSVEMAASRPSRPTSSASRVTLGHPGSFRAATSRSRLPGPLYIDRPQASRRWSLRWLPDVHRHHGRHLPRGSGGCTPILL